MKLDILGISVHPDDIELCAAGTLLACIAQGKKTGIVDLTQGELGTRGNAETRKQEAADSAKLMGLHIRETLDLADGFFTINEESLKKVITVIRKYQPEILLCNAIEDRHPDHKRASELVSQASFLSGLIKISTEENGKPQEAWRPKQVFHYIQDRYIEPDFVFDVTDFHEKKIEAILCYKTQFNTQEDDEPQTYISTPEFLDTIVGRSLMMGKKIGVRYGEGFTSEKKIGINNFDNLIK